jgi:DNA-binding NarL/FixJ family response regulator
MDMSKMRVAIVDRQRVFVDALCFRLSSESDLQVVCDCEDADRAWEALQESQPDVLILDGEIPLGKAFDLAVDVRQRLPGTKILLLFSAVSDGLLDQSLRLKIEGLLSRSESLTRLVQAIRMVSIGERPVSPTIAARLDFDPASGEYRLRVDANSKGLTDRQLEILRHLARGDSVKAVARKLFLSPKSVDNQKFRIMSKLGVRDKVSLALYAVREGLIQP